MDVPSHQIADGSDEQLSQSQLAAAHERRRILRDAGAVLDAGGTLEVAASAARTSTATLSRLLAIAHRDLPVHAPHRQKAAHLLMMPLVDLAPKVSGGRPDRWESFAQLDAVQRKLAALYLATVRASSESMTHGRHTGSVRLALERFAEEVECPEPLRALLRSGRHPAALRRFLGRITTDVEQRFRGSKHYALHSVSQTRDNTIALPDGRRVPNRAGFLIEFDDMSVNQPFWSEGPEGVILSRQGLYARDVRSRRWLGFELIARPREAYRAEDILRFIRRLMQRYGKFPVLRLEKGVWHSKSIRGFEVTPTGDINDVALVRAGMQDEERQLLQDGLRGIGIEIHYVSTAHQKGGLEGGFAELQRVIGTYTTEFANIGAHAGEFEAAARQLRRARAGSAHPGDLGFAHIDALGERIEQAVAFANRRVREGRKTADEIWIEDEEQFRPTALSERDLAVFLPHITEVTIRELKVSCTVRGTEFEFRAREFAQLGNGFRVVIRFDPGEPGLGAAVYNREGSTLRNHGGWCPGEMLCWAAHEIPAPEYHVRDAATAAPLGEARSIQEIYYPGAVNAGRGIQKLQLKDITGAVRTFASILGRPGDAPARTLTARTGTGRSLEASTRVEASPAEPVTKPASPAEPVELPYHVRKLLAD